MARVKAKPAFDCVVKRKAGRPPGGLPAGGANRKMTTVIQSNGQPHGIGASNQSTASPSGSGGTGSGVLVGLNQVNLEKMNSPANKKEKVVPLVVERPKREIRKKRGGMMDDELYDFGNSSSTGTGGEGKKNKATAPSSTTSSSSIGTGIGNGALDDRESKRVKRSVSASAQSDEPSLLGDAESKGKGRLLELLVPKSKISESISTTKGDDDEDSVANASSVVSGATGRLEDDDNASIVSSINPASGSGVP